jgi:hypothetical protein
MPLDPADTPAMRVPPGEVFEIDSVADHSEGAVAARMAGQAIRPVLTSDAARSAISLRGPTGSWVPSTSRAAPRATSSR